MTRGARNPATYRRLRPPRIGILIVTYNAETTIKSLLTRIPRHVLERCHEIFIFDDASADRTVEVALEYQSQSRPGLITVHRNPTNLMYGGNQAAGYRYAMWRDLDIVVLLHGDGQYAPEVLDDLLVPMEGGEADLVMGSRMMTAGGALRGRMPLYKFLGNRILTWVQNALVGSHLSEFHSGYRAYSVAALRSIPLDALTTNWHFDTQIILEFMRRGYRIKEVPIPTFYGDEICRVSGIPYAAHCVLECVGFAKSRRQRSRPDPEPEPAAITRLAK